MDALELPGNLGGHHDCVARNGNDPGRDDAGVPLAGGRITHAHRQDTFNLPPGGFLPGSAAHPRDFFWLGDSLPGWSILFLLAAGPTVAGFGLYLVSLVHLPSSVANLVVSLEPAFTTLFAFFFLGERLGGVQVAGSLLILSGVAILRIDEFWRPPSGIQAKTAEPAG